MEVKEVKKYKLRFLRNGSSFDFAVRCEELFNAINKNCFILAIESGTNEMDHMKIYQEIRFYGNPMGMDEIMAYILNNTNMFSPEIAYCKGIVLEDDGQKAIIFRDKIDIKNKKRTNGTKGPPE